MTKTGLSPRGLVSATLAASVVGGLVSLLFCARRAPFRSDEPGFFDWVQVAFAGFVAPLSFAGATALWLAFGIALERRWLAGAAGKERRLRALALSWLLVGFPAYGVVWALLAKSTAWKPGATAWQLALVLVLAAPLTRLLLTALSRGFERLRSERPASTAIASGLLSLAAFGAWAIATESLRERYGASQLLGYGLVTSGLVLLFGAWFRGRAQARADAVVLGALGAFGVLAFLLPPSRAALELFYLERPTRWFGRVLSALAPDADGDRVPRNLGFLRGGDCDDADPARSALAFDIPSNGIDENCFESDAPRAFEPSGVVAPGVLDAGSRQVRPSNVIVVALDSVRFFRDSPNGFDPAVMPVLSRLAAESLAFSDFRTCAPRTRESVPSLLGARLGQPVRAAFPNAVQALSARGVHTAFIASDWLARYAPLDGFREHHHPRARYGEFADGEVLAALSRFVADAPPRPFFVFSHFLGAHEPYDQGTACRRESGSPYARYLCALGELDRKVGVFLNALRAGGLLDESVLAITADHGEEFGEHGGSHHATTLYDEILHVPLLLRIPGRAPALIATPLNCFDFLPTVLGASGQLAGLSVRGRDRLNPPGAGSPAQFAHTRLPREASLFEPSASAVVYGGHKLIVDRTTGLGSYFDLRGDPSERRPLAQAPPAVRAELLALMDAWLSEEVATHPPASVQLSRLGSP